MPMTGEEFNEEIEKGIQDAIREASAKKVRCIRRTRCARNMTCEYAQIRNETAELQDLFVGKAPNLGDCENWKARRELNTGLDMPRRPAGAGSRHNSHVDRNAERKKLIEKIERGEGLPFSSHTPEELRNMLEASRRKKGK